MRLFFNDIADGSMSFGIWFIEVKLHIAEGTIFFSGNFLRQTWKKVYQTFLEFDNLPYNFNEHSALMHQVFSYMKSLVLYGDIGIW